MRICLKKFIKEDELLYADCSRYGWSNLRVVGVTEDNTVAYKYISENKIPLNALPTVHSTITERIMDYILEGFNPDTPSDLVKYIESKLGVKLSMDIIDDDEEIEEKEMRVENVVDNIEAVKPEQPLTSDGEEFSNDIEDSVTSDMKDTDNIVDEIDETFKNLEDKALSDLDVEIGAIDDVLSEVDNVAQEIAVEDVKEEEKEEEEEEEEVVNAKDLSDITNNEEVIEEENEVIEEKQVEVSNEEVQEEKEDEEVQVKEIIKETEKVERVNTITQASNLERLVGQELIKVEDIKGINEKLDNLTDLLKSVKSDVFKLNTEPRQLEDNKNNPNISLDIKTTLYLNILEKLKGEIVAETLAKVIRRAVEEENEALEGFLQTFFEEI